MSFIKGFEDLSKDDAAIAGGKGASLGEMTQASIPVPPGFVVLADAFEQFLRETGLLQEIDAILHSVRHDEMHTVEQASERIQALILNAAMPEDIAGEIRRQFEALNTEFVAVRSSATAEDSSSAAWAGQLDSYLNTTVDTLLANVQRCWASLFTPRAIFYRFEKDLHKTKISVAVVVQKMVQSEVSGIAFSVHPVTEDRNQLIIEAGFGLGEAIVSGSVTPDSYVIEKEPRRIIDKNVTYQSRALWRSENGGNEWRELSEEEGTKPALSDEQALELSEIILRIERHYGFPCDIEWAYEAGIFFITQSRPITTLSKKEEMTTFVSPQLVAFPREDYKFAGRWKSDLFAAYFWMHWFNREVLKKLDFSTPFSGCLSLHGGYFFYHKKVDEWGLAEMHRMFAVTDGTRSKNFREISEKEIERLLTEAEKFSEETPTAEAFRRVTEIGEEMMNYWVLANLVGNGVDTVIAERAIAEQVPAEIVADLIPKIPTQLDSQHKDAKRLLGLLRGKSLDTLLAGNHETLVSKIKADKNLRTEFEKHLKVFGWLELINFIGTPLTLERLLDQIKTSADSVRPQEQGVAVARKLSKEFRHILDTAADIGFVRQHAAENFSEFHFVLVPFLEKTAKKLGISYREMLNLVPQEIIDGLGGTKTHKQLEEIVRRRSNYNWLIFSDTKTEELVLVDDKEDIETLYKLMVPTVDEGTDSLVGQTGNKGKVQGRVSIVLATDDFHKFVEGSVLVTTMTTPDFVILMQKSAAIVTDIGGMLSHASIVSRELGKPCVIGTKFATQVLKDGDLVEVDADNGVVRIIERAGIEADITTSKVYLKLQEMEVFEKGVWVERGRWIQSPFVFTFYSHWHLSSLINRVVPGLKFHTAFTVDGYAFIRAEDEKKLADYIRGEYEKGTLGALVERIDAEGKVVVHRLRELLVRDDRYLRANLREFVSLYKEFTAFFSVEVYLGEQVLRVAKEVEYVPTEAELFEKVHPFLRKTWIEKEVDMMANIARDYIADKNEKKLTEKLQHYMQDYRWIQMVKWIGEPVDEAYARKRFEEEIKNCKEGNYIAPHHAKGKPDPMVELGVVTAYWRAECAGIEMQTSLRMQPILKSVAERLGITYEQVLLLPPHEMVVAAEEPSAITNLPEVLKREKGFFSTVTNDGEELILNNEQDEYKKIEKFHLTFDTSQTSDVLHGIGAAPGFVKGKVRIINSMKDADIFQQDEILVAPETTPSFVPLMRKASAILTGKGGITSHAAIVSRELKKPCVIAIKDVTRILHDGDLIEVDADKGVVRILERGKIEGKRKLDLFGYRDFTLALLDLGFEAESSPLPHLDNHTLTRPYFMGERENDRTGCFIDLSQTEWQKNQILARIEKDKNYVIDLTKRNYDGYAKIKKALDAEKPLTLEELKQFTIDTKHVWQWFAGLWWTIEILEQKNLYPELLDQMMDFRRKAEKFVPAADTVIRETIQKLYPKLGHYGEVLLLAEVLNGTIPDERVLKERYEHCLIADSRAYVGAEIGKAKEEMQIELVVPKPPSHDIQEIEGQVGYKGKYTGRVSLVFTKKKAHSFEKGRVLVASSSTPDFLPAIQKAGAIIADEGGIMSHAAICSREFKIPCIIGTKFATQVLHDGDLVEVDADNGIVRILK